MNNAVGFLEKFFGTNEFEINPMIGDAAARRYWRVIKGETSYVLMDGDVLKNKFEEFIKIDQLLKGLGVYVPGILACDMSEGFMLLEDLGDGTFARMIDLGADEKVLYELAVGHLIKIAKVEKAPDYLPVLDKQMIVDIILHFVDYYYWFEKNKKISKAKREEFVSIVSGLSPLAFKVKNGVSLRDYHVENLMLMSDHKTAAVIDFQDAFWAPITYDIVSLLEDARRDVSAQTQFEMKDLFFESLSGISRKDFEDSYAFVAMFRHMRVLGIFAKLKLESNKTKYLKFMPHVKKLLYKALENPILAEMKDWVEKNFGVFKESALVSKAMILAAGRGTRMRDMVDELPKPLIEVKGRALIDFRFDLLREVGIKDVVVNVCYQGDKIIKHLKRFEPEFKVVISEEIEALETGGGIKKALPYLGDEPFFSLNSDELWNDSSHKPVMWQMVEKWDDAKYDMILLINPMSSTHENGRDHGDYRINKKDRLERNVEKKPGGGYDYFYTGIALMSPKIFEDSPDGKFSMVKMFDKVEALGRLGYVIINDEIFHVGTPEDKAHAEDNFKV